MCFISLAWVIDLVIRLHLPKSNLGNSSKFPSPNLFRICCFSTSILAFLSAVMSTKLSPADVLFFLYSCNFSTNKFCIGSAFFAAFAITTAVTPIFRLKLVWKEPVVRESSCEHRKIAAIVYHSESQYSKWPTSWSVDSFWSGGEVDTNPPRGYSRSRWRTRSSL